MKIVAILLFTVLIVAVVFDLKWSKIPNWLTFAAFVAGICLQILDVGNYQDVLELLGSIALPFFVLLPFYVMGGMAAGDVKLMTACGAILGWPSAIAATGLSLLAGTILGLIYLVMRGGADGLILKFPALTKILILLDRKKEGDIVANGVAKSRFPYALAIAIGSTIAFTIR